MWTLNWKNTKKSRHSSQSREERDKVIGIFNFALILILSLSLQLELDIFTFHVRDEGEAGQVCPECAGFQGVPEDQEESWQNHRLKFRKQYSFKSLHLSADGGLVRPNKWGWDSFHTAAKINANAKGWCHQSLIYVKALPGINTEGWFRKLNSWMTR